MFDLWEPLENDLVFKIVAFQKDHCEENINSENIQADQCAICPYAGYKFIRLTFSSSQRIQYKDAKRYEVSTGSISYVLAKTDDKGHLSEVIPLHKTSENLYAINKYLRLKLTTDQVLPYLLFYGLIVSADEGSFYFVYNLNHINTITTGLDESSRSKLLGILGGSFNVLDNGMLNIIIKKKHTL